MGYRVANPKQVVEAIEALVGSETLLCIYLFDDRPSDQPVIESLSGHVEWVDSLSYQAGVVTLVMASRFVQTLGAPAWAGLETTLPGSALAFLEVLDKEVVCFNPSAIFARYLDISPRSLPGVLFIPPAQTLESDVRGYFLPLAIRNPSMDSIEQYLTLLYDGLKSILAGRSPHDLSAEAFRPLPGGAGTFETKIGLLSDLRDLAHRAVTTATARRTRLNVGKYMPVADRSTARIFISYSSEDRLSARVIAEKMREVGFAPWIDVVNLLPGEDWERAINVALREADFFIACLSKKSVAKRGYVQREFKRALTIWEEKLTSDIYLIPLRLDDCEVPSDLRRFQWVDWTDGCGLTSVVAAITEGMRRLGRIAG